MSDYHTKNTERFGSAGGDEFTESFENIGKRGKIVQIFVRATTHVNGLTVVFADGTTISHGTDGGDFHLIMFDQNEYVKSIKLRSGVYLDSITFTTNLKKTYGPYGGLGGIYHNVSLEGKYLQYLFGRSDYYFIDQIGFAYGDALPAIATIDTMTKVPVHGGAGTAWDDFADLKVLWPIKKINITLNGVKYISSIAVTYITPTGETTTHRGTTGATACPEFVLNSGECITRIDVNTGDRTDGIQFTLNSGRQSIWYGSRGGGANAFIAPSGLMISSFHGRTSGEVTALGVYYSNVGAHADIDEVDSLPNV